MPAMPPIPLYVRTSRRRDCRGCSRGDAGLRPTTPSPRSTGGGSAPTIRSSASARDQAAHPRRRCIPRRPIRPQPRRHAAPHRRHRVVDQTLSEHRAAEGPTDERCHPRFGQCRAPLSPNQMIAVGTRITARPPGHRRRSPTPGSHRTWRAALPHHALRRLIHSTASACSFPYGRRSLGFSNGVRSLILLKASQVRRRPARLRLRSILRQ